MKAEEMDAHAESQQDVATLRVALPIIEVYTQKREGEILAGLLRLYYDGALTTQHAPLYAAIAGIAELRTLVRSVTRTLAVQTQTLATREPS